MTTKLMRRWKAMAAGALLFTALSLSAAAMHRKSKIQEIDGNGAIEKMESTFRVARVLQNTKQLENLLADEYVGINQNGNRRDKQALLALFRTYKIDSMEISDLEVATGESVAVATGTQTEQVCGEANELLFTRVYIKRAGRWLLTANTQFRKPTDKSP